MDADLSERGAIITDICIIGSGMLTPIGINAPMTASSVRCGISRFRETYMIDRAGNNMVVSLVSVIDEALMGLERFATLALPAAKESLAVLDKTVLGQIRLPLFLALPPDRPGLDSRIGTELVTRLGMELGILFSTVELLPYGHAAGLMGLEKAVQVLKTGQAEACMVGGVDSYWHPDTLEWLDENKRLKSDVNPDGFIPGEGAGFLLVTTMPWAQRYNLKPQGTILSTASDREPHPFVSDGVCIGEGLTRALQKALKILDGTEYKADWVICDMNGESFRGNEWAYAYLRTGKYHRDPLEIWHPADCWGDMGAASGLLLTPIALEAMNRHYSRGTNPLIFTASDTQERSAVILGAV